MRLIPYQRITYKTALQKEEVYKALKNEIAIEKKILLGLATTTEDSDAHKMFEGKLTVNYFKITRKSKDDETVILISGDLKRTTSGTAIHVVIRLPVFYYVFLIVWSTFAWSSFVIVPDSIVQMISLAMILAPFSILVNNYNRNRKKTLKEFQNLIEADFNT